MRHPWAVGRGTGCSCSEYTIAAFGSPRTSSVSEVRHEQAAYRLKPWTELVRPKMRSAVERGQHRSREFSQITER
jgi:hypothetical protein